MHIVSVFVIEIYFFFQILWDENTKKWINKDETAAESEAFKPPPKMDFPQMQPMPQQQAELPNSLPALTPQQNHMPQMNPATNNDFSNSHVSEEQTQMSKVEPPSQNMFKMQKGRSEINYFIFLSIKLLTKLFFLIEDIKKSYVNLLSNSGQTVAAKEIAPDIQQTLFTPISQQQVSLEFSIKILLNIFLMFFLFQYYSTAANNAVLQPKRFPLSSSCRHVAVT